MGCDNASVPLSARERARSAVQGCRGDPRGPPSTVDPPAVGSLRAYRFAAPYREATSSQFTSCQKAAM